MTLRCFVSLCILLMSFSLLSAFAQGRGQGQPPATAAAQNQPAQAAKPPEPKKETPEQ